LLVEGKPGMIRRILLVVRVGGGNGIGHLKRSTRLLEGLEANIDILAESDSTFSAIPPLPRLKDSAFTDKAEAMKRAPYDLVIVDARQSTREKLLFYEQLGPVVGIDEGGEARKRFPFLIDSFHRSLSRDRPNLYLNPLTLSEYRMVREHPSFSSRKRNRSARGRILITFGGEDPANLTEKLLESLSDDFFTEHYDFSVVIGPLFERDLKEAVKKYKVDIFEGLNELESLIVKHDIVITSFGNTLFEAISKGVPVILFNPTPYHRKLGRELGIPDIGIKKPNTKRLKKLLSDIGNSGDAYFERIRMDSRGDVNNFSGIAERIFRGNMNCPICRSYNESVARFKDRTYFRCSSCGIIYMSYFGEKKIEYGRGYFFDEYRAQYGKTYLEDFGKIKSLGKSRLSFIQDILRLSEISDSPVEKRLLDVGCAYGAFLDAARESGCSVTGIDVSSDAIGYVRKKLEIDALEDDFISWQADKYERSFDIVTMWYVIEHFENLGKALKRVNRILSPGGIFAFSTPNAAGISARRDMNDFLGKSPPDHYTILAPESSRKILKKYGFRVEKINITGYHRERFPLNGIIPDKILFLAGKLLNLGDTFEVYAVKEHDIEQSKGVENRK